MNLDLLLKIPVGLLPVLVFLGALLYLDSYRLVKLHLVIRVLLGGALTAVFAYFINAYVINALNMEFMNYTHYVSPILEESLKGLVVVYLFRSNRIGFLVDSAIMGFAVGAGFALVENLYYLYHATDAHIAVWIVRGFGTAVMHGVSVSCMTGWKWILMPTRSCWRISTPEILRTARPAGFCLICVIVLMA